MSISQEILKDSIDQFHQHEPNHLHPNVSLCQAVHCEEYGILNQK